MSRSCFDDNSARWDRERDERKHDPRPGDRDYVPLCAQAAPMPTALEVALIVRGLADPIKGADLIEQYARTVASAKEIETVERVGNRLVAALESPLARKESSDA